MKFIMKLRSNANPKKSQVLKVQTLNALKTDHSGIKILFLALDVQLLSLFIM